MRRAEKFDAPPRAATWLVGLFTSSAHAESIQGDLQEEFFPLVAKSGIAFARRWYWRQSLKTIFSLIGADFRSAPWTLAFAVASGFFLQWFGASLPERLIELVLHKIPIYPNHWNAYVFWMTDGILIGELLESILLGAIVATAAKGKELVATITLGVGLLLIGTATHVLWMAVHRPDSLFALQQIVNLFIHTIAIVEGGVIIREFRPSESHRTARI